jgi:hypothetical protein
VTEHLDNHAVAHEESDVNVRAILGIGAGLFAVCAVVCVVAALLFTYFTGAAARVPRMFPLAAERQTQLPPEPRLQTSPREDMEKLRAGESAVLESYGWVDRKAGIARIPIEKAMKLTVQHGLPTR